VAAVGIRGCGESHPLELAGTKDVEVAAIADADSRLLSAVRKKLDEQSGTKPATGRVLQALLDDKAIDAVSIATPHHRHVPIANAACRAGKEGRGNERRLPSSPFP
jgi:predicted dehydrogenase